LEAITAALPVCDEFLISEGYSSDETWQALQWLQKKYPDKIKLYRDEWNGDRKGGEVIAVMQNVILERCCGAYCLSVQANEVLHETACTELRVLPELYPGIEIFSLPYYIMLGSHILWTVELRRRLFKNRPYIRCFGDGYDVYYDRSRLWTQPRKLIDYYTRGIGVRAYYLLQPFYRYGALYPRSFMKKLETHNEIYRAPQVVNAYLEMHAHVQSALGESCARNESVRECWNRARVYFDTLNANKTPSPTEHLPRRTIREVDTHPRVMSHLLHRWDYDWQASKHVLDTYSID
jgi:hypothetical protein